MAAARSKQKQPRRKEQPSIDENTKHHQRPSSISSSSASSSSPHSPSGSISSTARTIDTGISSPTLSVHEDVLSSFKLYNRPPTPLPMKKKVSFEEAESVPVVPEPWTRPDSPTLGFSDNAGGECHSPPPLELGASAAAAVAFGELSQLSTSQLLEEVESESGRLTPVMSEVATMPLSPPRYDRASLLVRPLFADLVRADEQEPEEFDAEEDEEDSVSPTCPVDRYREHLAALKVQVASHSAELDALLEAPSSTATKAADRRSPVKTQASGRAGRRARGVGLGLSGVSDGDVEDPRALERRARIERLREGGWQRRRFDAARYESLCDDVLAELN